MNQYQTDDLTNVSNQRDITVELIVAHTVDVVS